MATTHTARILGILVMLWCGARAPADQNKRAGRDETTGTEQRQMLIEPDQLLKILQQPQVRILDARTKAEYAESHVPGAVHVDVNEWKALAFTDRGLHDSTAWAAKLGSLGITADAQVVVYGTRQTDTARVWWLLKYVGVGKVSILNGGWTWWMKGGRPVKSSTPNISTTKFKPKFQTNRLAEIDAVKESLRTKRLKIVDTRSRLEFIGGRIPTATHLEWKELLAEDGRFKTRDQLRELFRERGIQPTDAAVCY